VGLPVALAVVGVDYLTPRYLIPSFIPLAFLWAAPLDAPGRLRPAVTIAGCAALALATVHMLSSNALQRPAWRAAAKALGPAKGNRAVVAPHEGLPLRVYM